MNQPSAIRQALDNMADLENNCWEERYRSRTDLRKAYYDGYAKGARHAYRILTEAAIE